MEIDRIPRNVEKPFRDAVDYAIKNEFDDMWSTLADLAVEQRAACLGLCAFVTGYVAIDVCGRQWPIETNLRKIAERSTKSTNARKFGLKADDSYDYIKRVALGFEALDKVFPSPEDAVTLSFKITGHVLIAFHPADIKWWEYLNRIEEVYEVAQAADLDLLPALMLRSRKLGSPRVFGEIPR